MNKLKLISLILALLMLAAAFAACKTQDTQNSAVSDNTPTLTTADSENTSSENNTATTAEDNENVTGATVNGNEEGTMVYRFAKYGYDITYPSVFEVINEDGNMVEFRTASGADFTILVLDNRYADVDGMISGEVDEDSEVVTQGEDSFLAKNVFNGRTTYTYYYCSEKMVSCELTYPDTLSAEMNGLENLISVAKD